MNKKYLDKITQGDCRDHISHLTDNSIELFLSDIPYGINLDDWDVLHDNMNSALLGQSPAQVGKSAFKRRGLEAEAEAWHGWRLGNMVPVYEPIY